MRRIQKVLFWLAWLAPCAPLPAPSAREAAADGDPIGIPIDADDLVVTSSTVVRPGTYRVLDKNGDGVIHVRGKGVRLDLTGVVLDGSQEGAEPATYAGIGISVEGSEGCEIVGGNARGFRVGLRAQGCPGLRVTGFDGSGNRRDRLKSTPEAEDADDWLWPHENDQGQWETRHGAAISLAACPLAQVRGCSAHHGQNGLLLSRCDRCAVTSNDFSFNSGWGIALWRTSHGQLVSNRCDFCVRGYSHGVYARGQDSAGFLVFEQCSDNLFASNSATHSGDGFFLYAGNETLKSTGKGGCNGNRVVRNDFSHAVANGIEATFSDGNVFDENVLDDCDHGVWAGYSTNTTIARNRMVACAHGVSIEHGSGNRIFANELRRCGVGVHLWWDEDEDLLASAFGRAHPGAPSERNLLTLNRFAGCTTALRLDGDDACVVSGNRFEDSGVGIHVSGERGAPRVYGNGFGPPRAVDGVAVKSDSKAPWRLGLNAWSPFPQRLAGSVALEEKRGDAIPEPGMPPSVDVPAVPEGAGRADARFAKLDRSAIFVDEAGPVEPSEIRILGPAPGSTSTATIHVRGPGVPFTAGSLDAGFTVEPASGRTPARLDLRSAGTASGRAFAPYAVRVRVGDQEKTFRGTLWGLPWRVRFFEWTKDPREDAAAFAQLIAGPAVDEVSMSVLDGAWPGKPTPKVRGDRFVTVAETKGTFSAGRYRVHVTSDDGVRVLVDGRAVLEDWTWHGPKDADVDVELADGEHTLRVEHFELDGYATLRVRVGPVPDAR